MYRIPKTSYRSSGRRTVNRPPGEVLWKCGKASVAGVVIEAIGTLAIATLLPAFYTMALRLGGYGELAAKQLVMNLPNTGYPVIGVAIALLVPVGAGYVTGRIANGAEYWAASVVASVSAPFGLIIVPAAFGIHSSAGYPFGSYILVGVLSVCCVLIGARLAARASAAGVA